VQRVPQHLLRLPVALPKDSPKVQLENEWDLPLLLFLRLLT